MRERNHRIQFRLNDTEYNRFKNKVQKSGLKTEQFLRKAISNAQIKEPPTEEYRRIIYLLSNLSNNINQIAKHTNTTGIIDIPSLDAAVILLRKCYKQMEVL